MVRTAILLVALALFPSAGLLGAEEISVIMGSERVAKRVKNFKELRRQGTVLQELDYSCGAAALATLLTYHFGDKVGESEVIGFIFVHGQTPEEGLKKYFRRQGFSLLDLKRFSEFRGYKVAAFKEMELQDLAEFLWIERLPVMVPIVPMGYNHFVVLKGIRGNRVYYADPAVGNMSMTIARFSDIWLGGIGMVISKNDLASVTRRLVANEDELKNVTAAGSAEVPGAGESSTESALLIPPDQGVFPDARGATQSVVEGDRSIVYPQVMPTFSSDLNPVLTRFSVTNYNPTIQFGDPAGDFMDFTPNNGRPLIIQQQ